MFGFTQLIKSPTRITCNSTSLIDHMLASLPNRISQEGEINVGLSDHQLIYCTRKISRVKTGGVHKSNSVQLRITRLMLIKRLWKKLILPSTNILKMLIGRIQTSFKY